MEPANEEFFKYTFIFEHRDGTDTFTAKSDSFILMDVLKNFVSFLHDERVGFQNPITLIVHDGLHGDVVIECPSPHPSAE